MFGSTSRAGQSLHPTMPLSSSAILVCSAIFSIRAPYPPCEFAAQAAARVRLGQFINIVPKFFSNELKICWQNNAILCAFVCTSTSTTSKDNVNSMDLHPALEEPNVQLLTRQQDIDATLVRCGGPHIEPMENLNDPSLDTCSRS